MVLPQSGPVFICFCHSLVLFLSNFFCHSPVLFYIHGGGFAMGSGAGIFGEISNLISLLLTPGMENSAEDYFMESDIVLVTINYRLGPLGFMAIPGTNIQVLHNLENQGQSSCIRGIFFSQGNMGMKDQLLAMRWIKQNIAR